DLLARAAVEHGDLRLAPEAHVNAAPLIVQREAEGVRIGPERPLAGQLASADRLEPCDGVAEDVGDPEGPAVLREGEPGHAPVAAPLEGLGEGELTLVREQAGGVVEAVDDVVPAAADLEG